MHDTRHLERVERLYRLRAVRVAQFLSLVPYLRLIGLNGSLARGKIRETSDIDFLIVSTPGRLFTVRFLVTLIVHLFGLRRYGPYIAGRICLNRYQTTDHLEVTPHNMYHGEVFSPMIPLVNLRETYEQYVRANQWMEQTGYPIRYRHLRGYQNLTGFMAPFRRLAEFLLKGTIGDRIENYLTRYQTKKILAHPLTYQYPDRIKVSDHLLLFHPPGPGEIDDDLHRWDIVADEYNTLQGKVGDPFRRLIVDPVIFDFLGTIRGTRILDAGCGNGYIAAKLHKCGAKVSGVDWSVMMIARAKQNFPDLDFRVFNIEQSLPFAEGEFHKIVASMVIQDVRDPERALVQLVRHLAPDGDLILAIPHPCYAYPAGVIRKTWWQKILGRPGHFLIQEYALDRKVTVPIQGMRHATPRHHRTLSQYWQLFERSGLVIREMREPTIRDVDQLRRGQQLPWLDQLRPYGTIPLALVLRLKKT